MVVSVVTVRLADRAKKLTGDELQNTPLPGRQRGNARVFGAYGRHNGVMVADLGAVAYLLGDNRIRGFYAADRSGDGDQRGDARLHIVGEESAVVRGYVQSRFS